MSALGPSSRVRYQVLAFLCALAFILYIDRVCIAQAALSMQADLGIDQAAMGLVFGSFTLAYALFELPTGRWGDRYGSRVVLVRVVLWWSLFTALTGALWRFAWDVPFQFTVYGAPLFGSLGLLLLVRFLFGAGEAGALPNVARVLAQWFPAHDRGFAQGMITTSTLVGGAIAPLCTAVLIERFGWRLAFAIFGCLGVVWAAAFSRWFRDDPAQHPAVNPAELALLTAGRAERSTTHDAIPWRSIRRSATFWVLAYILTCASAVSYMYFSWYPTYLQLGRAEALAVTTTWAADYVGEISTGKAASVLAGLVLAGGACGSLLGGRWLDRLCHWTGERSWTPRLLASVCFALSASLLLGGLACEDTVAVASLTASSFFFANMAHVCWWSVTTMFAGKHLGTLFGLLNAISMSGAFLSQTQLGAFAESRKALGFMGRDQWDPAFYMYAALLASASVAWLFVDGRRRLDHS